MKMTFGFVLLMFSLSSFAQGLTCIDKLLPNSRYSGAHQVTHDDWDDAGKEFLDVQDTIEAFNTLITGKLFCKQDEVTIKLTPVCSTLVAGMPQSTTCYFYTNLGYVFASKDLGHNVNFVFSKDKRFQEEQ